MNVEGVEGNETNWDGDQARPIVPSKKEDNNVEAPTLWIRKHT